MAETKQKKRFSLFRRKKPAVQAVAKKKVPVAPQAKAPVETPKNPESLPTVVSVENTDTVANEPTTPVADNREKSMKNREFHSDGKDTIRMTTATLTHFLYSNPHQKKTSR